MKNNLWIVRGHVNSPSRKGHENAELPGVENFWTFSPMSPQKRGKYLGNPQANFDFFLGRRFLVNKKSNTRWWLKSKKGRIPEFFTQRYRHHTKQASHHTRHKGSIWNPKTYRPKKRVFKKNCAGLQDFKVWFFSNFSFSGCFFLGKVFGTWR